MVVHLVKTVCPLVIWAALVRPHIPVWWWQHVSPWAQPSPGVTSEIAQGSLGRLSAVLSGDSSWLILKSPPPLSSGDYRQRGQAFNFPWVPWVPSKSLLPLICSQYLLKNSRRVKHRNYLLSPSPLYRKLCDCETRDLVLGSHYAGPRRCCDWHLKKSRRDRIKSSK